MTVSEGIAGLLLWVIFFGLFVALMKGFRTYRIDLLRHYLFVCRDELMEAALDGTLSFDDKAYVMLRQNINNMLRFSHKASLVRAYITQWLCRLGEPAESDDSYSLEWEQAVSELPNERARQEVARIRHNISVVVTLTSILGFYWTVLVEIGSFLRRSPAKVKDVPARLVRECRVVELEARHAGEGPMRSTLA